MKMLILVEEQVWLTGKGSQNKNAGGASSLKQLHQLRQTAFVHV